jgi:DNA-binding phage protein
MKIYGTWHAFLIEQLKEKEDVKGFLDAVIEEYQIHGNLAIIQLALQYVAEAQGGISELAKKIDIESALLSEVLEDTKAPRIDTLRTILGALGCCLPIEALETESPPITVATDESAVHSIETVDPNHNLD